MILILDISCHRSLHGYFAHRPLRITLRCILGRFASFGISRKPLILQMSDQKSLTELNRDELGVYLRDRGIPFSTRNKNERLVLATIAERRNIPLKSSDDLQKIVEERQQRLILEDGLIKLPDPTKILSGWERDFINFPNTTSADVEDFVSVSTSLFYEKGGGGNNIFTWSWCSHHIKG